MCKEVRECEKERESMCKEERQREREKSMLSSSRATYLVFIGLRIGHIEQNQS